MSSNPSATKKLPLGPIMTSIEGTELTADDREVLAHPLIG